MSNTSDTSGENHEMNDVSFVTAAEDGPLESQSSGSGEFVQRSASGAPAEASGGVTQQDVSMDSPSDHDKMLASNDAAASVEVEATKGKTSHLLRRLVFAMVFVQEESFHK